MTNRTHESKILANIEELNFCFECKKDLFPLAGHFNTCSDCDRSFCVECSRCACFGSADATSQNAFAAQKLLESGEGRA